MVVEGKKMTKKMVEEDAGRMEQRLHIFEFNPKRTCVYGHIHVIYITNVKRNLARRMSSMFTQSFHQWVTSYGPKLHKTLGTRGLHSLRKGDIISFCVKTLRGL